MKGILIIVLAFGLAFLTSCLLDIEFFRSNWIRYSLVVMLVVLELLYGFWLLKSIFRK